MLACYRSQGFTSCRESFSKNPLLGGIREVRRELSCDFIVLIKGAGHGLQLQHEAEGILQGLAEVCVAEVIMLNKESSERTMWRLKCRRTEGV